MNNISMQTETVLWHIIEALVSAIDERNKDLNDFLQKIGCDVNTISQLRKDAEQFRQNFTRFTTNI